LPEVYYNHTGIATVLSRGLKMKILVHLHLYYIDMLPEMLDYLRSLEGRDYDLCVTVVKEDTELREKLLAFKPETKILTVENRGYDLAPFLSVLHDVDLDKYDYLIKLHTKRDLPRPAYLPDGKFTGSEWRECLMGFLKNKQAFDRTMEIMEKKPDIGMLSHWKLIINAGKEDREANRRAEGIMQKIGLQPQQKLFVAGTMFICRAELMKPLLKLNYAVNDFDVPAADHSGGTLAHALERVLGWIIYAQKYQIGSYELKRVKDRLRIWAYKSGRFLYRKHTNSKGVTRIKICKIPVCKYHL